MHKTDYPRKIKENVFLIWKELGETPLQALKWLRKSEGISANIPMTYAGRLDPLAEGELLVLIGDECKKKDKYLGLDKEYEVEVLLDAKTDTGDVMGIVTTTSQNSYITTPRSNLDIDEVDAILQRFVGKVSWSYPAFSSKTVQGKPLFLWALESKIKEIELPVRESEVYELELVGDKLGNPITKLSVSKLRELVHIKINSIKKVSENIVNGRDTKRIGADFRREEVLQGWADFFDKWSERVSDRKFETVNIRCKCSSGTYMRTLAQKVGEELGTSALALSIVRTKIVM